MRVVLWLENDEIQCALANKIFTSFEVVGIVKETRKVPKKFSFRKVFEALLERIFLPDLRSAWLNLKRYYRLRYPSFPNVSMLEVENINDSLVRIFSEDLSPDLIVVSGTRMIRNENLNTNIRIGMLNLHTGLSPYIKGGPNCTNWCLAESMIGYIGNTVMWIDQGIDTGSIFFSEFVPLENVKSLSDLHVRVMEEAHKLYIVSLASVKNSAIQRVPQKEIGEGITYYSKQWNLLKKYKAIRNMNLLGDSEFLLKIRYQREDIKVVRSLGLDSGLNSNE